MTRRRFPILVLPLAVASACSSTETPEPQTTPHRDAGADRSTDATQEDGVGSGGAPTGGSGGAPTGGSGGAPTGGSGGVPTGGSGGVPTGGSGGVPTGGSGGGPGGSAGSGVGGNGGTPSSCDAIPASPVALSFLPSQPWDGGSVRVNVTGPDALTNVGIDVTGPVTAPDPSWIGVEGEGPYTWSWSLSPIYAGDYCVSFHDGTDAVLQRAALNVADGPPVGTPIYKVASNHQWTCEEEYTWAINVDTTVLDENGNPLPGIRVLVEHAPCDTAADHPPPAELVTGDDGTVRWENYNPKCYFHERVADGPSDTAIEIYSGIWETQVDDSGVDCNYCSTYAENVYGHWSYSIVFQRLPATETCQVPVDHAGQSNCSPLNHWEEPSEGCSPL